MGRSERRGRRRSGLVLGLLRRAGHVLEVPSAWTFTAYRLARLKMVVGGREDSKILASDLADAHHVSCGPYVDVIVSDDVGLRRAFALIADRVSFKVVGSAEFNMDAGLMPPD